MSKNPGKRFEEDFVKSIPEYCDVTRLKDAGGWSNATNMRFTSKNPCDFIVYSHGDDYYGGLMYKLELKSLLGKSLPYANIKPKTKKLTALENSIKFVNVLTESQNKGVWAGFIVNFRDVDQTFKILASDVLGFLMTETRKSIPLAWFRDNGIEIKQTKKITRWRYDLSCL